MTILLRTTYKRTLTSLLQRYARATNSGMRLEAWLFDDVKNRRAAEAELAAHGITARLHSAYKPLLHFFLEDLHLKASGITGVTVLYPQCAGALENRFLLETYPLAALVGNIPLSFAPGRQEECIYDIILTHESGKKSTQQVFAPNRRHENVAGTLLSPTGWLRVHDSDGALLVDERLETDFETLFTEILHGVAAHPWGDKEPYFEELNIRVDLPGRDLPLDFGRESISLHEALHEDLYFSLLEFFQLRAGRPLGDRGLQPGQIVPEIHHRDGDPGVTIELRPLDKGEMAGPVQEIASAGHPLTCAQIHRELEKIEGTPFTAISRAGRNIEGRYHVGGDFAVMISGGQHANETSGIVGALRAAGILAGKRETHFTIAPLENPDGYALHQRLIADNPDHMHHAARYTALGDDLGHRRGDLYERRIRTQAQQLSQAELHINLHGYPSHEWTRPLSGYIPRGFALWTLPKGFFLIMNYHSAWKERAEIFIAGVTAKLAAVPGLQTFTRRQMELYHIHASTSAFRIIGGFPCLLTEDNEQEIPLSLTTEYPDETLHGAAFIAGHEAQTATVLAAYDAYQELRRPANGGKP